MLRTFFITLLVLLHACSTQSKLTDAELQSIENPSTQMKASVEATAQLFEPWYTQSGIKASTQGRQLSNSEIADAALLGVRHADKVRVIVTELFPMPSEGEALKTAQQFGLGSNEEGGRTHGYSIFIKPKYANSKWLLRHEFVHVAQTERMGSSNFLRRYITEIKTVGYARAPLEVEANKASSALKE